MDREGRRERVVALLVVVVVHATGAAWLAGWRVPQDRMPATTHADEALLVEFITSAERTNTVTRVPHARDVRPGPVSAPRDELPAHAARGAPAPASRDDTNSPEDSASAALDLRVPVPAVDAPIVTRDAFERSPRLPGRPTRFERRWAPDGNALDVASWRSPVVRAALGLFGAPPRKCDEVERRLRIPECLPDEEDFERR